MAGGRGASRRVLVGGLDQVGGPAGRPSHGPTADGERALPGHRRRAGQLRPRLRREPAAHTPALLMPPVPAALDMSKCRLTSRARARTLVCRRHRGGTMSDTKTAGQELQGEILKTVRKSQETVVDAIQMWTDAVQAIKPPMPDVSIPFSDKLPKPSELVAGAYDFAEQLLAAQRKFAEDVLHATAPLFYGETVPAAKKASGTAK